MISISTAIMPIRLGFRPDRNSFEFHEVGLGLSHGLSLFPGAL